MDPEMLAIILFHLFFERESLLFFYKRVCSPNLFNILAKLKQGRDENCTKQRGIWYCAQSVLLESDFCLLCMLCKFYYLKRFWVLTYLQHELEDFTQQIWKVSLQGFVQKDMHPKFTVVLLQSSLTKIQLHAEFD